MPSAYRPDFDTEHRIIEPATYTTLAQADRYAIDAFGVPIKDDGTRFAGGWRSAAAVAVESSPAARARCSTRCGFRWLRYSSSCGVSSVSSVGSSWRSTSARCRTGAAPGYDETTHPFVAAGIAGALTSAVIALVGFAVLGYIRARLSEAE